MGWVAYVDESMHAASRSYVLAAAVFEGDLAGALRDSVRVLAPRPGTRFHWRDQVPAGREKAAGLVAGFPALHLVVIGMPTDPRRRERARRQCLGELLFHLESVGVRQVWLETRTASLNSRDMAAVRAFRARRLIRHETRVDHAYPSAEPLLWIPDVVAGAVTAGHAGEQRYRQQLDEVIAEYRITLA